MATVQVPLSVTVSMNDDFRASAQNPHVSYFSHKWREEDLLQSWRSITRKNLKNITFNGVRLENQSWRAWWRVSQMNKETVSNQTLDSVHNLITGVPSLISFPGSDIPTFFAGPAYSYRLGATLSRTARSKRARETGSTPQTQRHRWHTSTASASSSDPKRLDDCTMATP
jgi:hypothetical protein